MRLDRQEHVHMVRVLEPVELVELELVVLEPVEVVVLEPQDYTSRF